MAHQHQHHHEIPQQFNVNKVFIISIALNVVYVVCELVAGLLYNSMALLTDAGHNASDVASLLLSLLAFKLAQKKSSAKFTYGYKKTTILAALTNAVILLIAIGILGYETIQRFSEPYAVQGNIIAWVAGIGIIINAISAFLFFKNRKTDLNIKSAYLHLLADALVSVGVVVAGVIISFTGWFIIDPIMGLIVLIIILLSTWQLLTDSFKLAVDAVPADIDLENIKHLIQEIPQVQAVEHVHIWAISTTENALTARVMLQEDLSTAARAKVIAYIKHLLEHEHISHSTLETYTAAEKEDKLC